MLVVRQVETVDASAAADELRHISHVIIKIRRDVKIQGVYMDRREVFEKTVAARWLIGVHEEILPSGRKEHSVAARRRVKMRRDFSRDIAVLVCCG